MVLVEEFPALTKSEPISFGSTCPRKARAVSPFTHAGESNRKDFLAPNHSKKRRLKKHQKKALSSQDDCPDIHSADELAHAFTQATGASLRNAHFGSVASIWRQQNSTEHTASSLFRSRFDAVARVEDEGFVDGRTESSSLTSMRDTEHCFHCDVPSLTALGDYCHTREGALRLTVPNHIHHPVNQTDSASDTSRSRQDSSSENNSVVFGSPDLPRLWDSSGQETINRIPNHLKDIDTVPSARTTHSNCCTQRTTRCLTSHERTTAGAVGDVDEDDMEGSDLLHLISNSLDRFNEIVHPHELGVIDDSLLLCADSVDLCSSGYGSFDQQPQQLLHSSEKFSFKTSVGDDSANPAWIDRPNHGSDSQSAPVPYFLAGDVETSLKDTRTTACPSTDSITLGPGNGHSNNGVTNRTVPQTVFSNGSDPVMDNFSGVPSSVKPGSISAATTGSVTSTADLGASMLRRFGLGTTIPNLPELSKTHETTQPNIKQSSTDWFELLACAIRALHEGANRTTQLKGSVATTASVDEFSKKGLLDLDTILNSLTMLGINQPAMNTQWNQENRKPPTNDDFCERNIALDAIPNVVMQTPLASDGHCGPPSRMHRNTLNSGDLEQLHNQQQQQQQHLSKQNFTGRRSVLSACFPTSSPVNHHSNSWDGTNGCNQPVTEHNASTTFRGQHRTNRRHNNSCGSACPTSLLLPPKRSNATGMTEASFVLSNSSQTAPSLASTAQFNAGRNSATPLLSMESKASNRPIVFHLQEFLRHGNNGNHKRAQYDRPFDFFTGMRSSSQRPGGTTNTRSMASSPFGNSTKVSSLGSGSAASSSNSSTCGSTNPDQQAQSSSSEIGANGKPVIAKWRRACSFYLRGHCKKEDCEFAHDLTKVTCKFWEMGECFKGPTCPFLHGYPPELMSQDQ